MTRLLYLLTRRSDISQDEFNDHWGVHHVNTHGQDVATWRRYVRYEVDQADLGNYTGAVSVWSRGIKSMRNTLARAMTAATKDEQRFIDHARSRALIVDDRTLREPIHGSSIVTFECLSFRESDSNTLEAAANELLRMDVAETLLKGLVLSTTRTPTVSATAPFDALGPRDPVWDVIVGYYFDSKLAARTLLEGPHSLGAALREQIAERKVMPPAMRRSIREPVR